MNRKIYIVTGATSGMGYETVKQLINDYVLIIGIGRNKDLNHKCENTLRKINKNSTIKYFTCDLSSLSQIRDLAESIKLYISKLNINKIDSLINNAGTYSSWFIQTEDCYELQFMVNHLAPFLLTHLLFDYISKSEDGRIITVSSGSHYKSKIHFNDVMLSHKYSGLKAYKQSKLSNVLFTNYLNNILDLHENISAYTVDPGLVNTELGLKNAHGISRLFWKYRMKKGSDVSIGAKTSVYLASNLLIEKSSISSYYKNCKAIAPSKNSNNKELQSKLWQLSEKLCDIKQDEVLR